MPTVLAWNESSTCMCLFELNGGSSVSQWHKWIQVLVWTVTAKFGASAWWKSLLNLMDDVLILVDMPSIQSLLSKERVHHQYSLFSHAAPIVHSSAFVWNKVSIQNICFVSGFLVLIDYMLMTCCLGGVCWRIICIHLVAETGDHLFG